MEPNTATIPRPLTDVTDVMETIRKAALTVADRVIARSGDPMVTKAAAAFFSAPAVLKALHMNNG